MNERALTLIGFSAILAGLAGCARIPPRPLSPERIAGVSLWGTFGPRRCGNVARLTVNLHHLSNACSNELVSQLSEELNAMETIFPGTQLRMVFKLVSG